METKHVKMVWSGRPRVQSQSLIDVDTRRRAVTPALLIPRPTLVRRHSVNGKSVIHTVENQNKHELPLYRGRRDDDVKPRDSISRKQTTPMATKTTTGEQNIKPILKSTRDKTVHESHNSVATAITKTTQTTTATSTTTTLADNRDGKFCYRLPDNPQIKLRKSVSFQDDTVTSAHNFHRLSSGHYARRHLSDLKETQIYV